jgi:hypothetical protein
MPMLEIMSPDEIWAILAAYTCPECWRQLRNHTPSERQTCHDHALSNVTLLRKVTGHNAHRRTDKGSERHQT